MSGRVRSNLSRNPSIEASIRLTSAMMTRKGKWSILKIKFWKAKRKSSRKLKLLKSSSNSTWQSNRKKSSTRWGCCSKRFKKWLTQAMSLRLHLSSNKLGLIRSNSNRLGIFQDKVLEQKKLKGKQSKYNGDNKSDVEHKCDAAALSQAERATWNSEAILKVRKIPKLYHI